MATITENNVHIEDSWEIRTRQTMETMLNHYRVTNPECKTWLRTNKELIQEWRAHNLLYDLHLFRSHTKDVDLDYPQSRKRKVIWAILSFFYIGI